MIKASRLLLLLAITLYWAPNTRAEQSLNAEALREIKDFAADFCGEYAPGGSNERFVAKGAAKAKLDGFLGKLAKIGIEGAAEFDSENYIGVLQKEIGGELKSVRDCRLKIWNDLKAAVIDRDTGVSPRGAPITCEQIWIEYDSGSLFAAHASGAVQCYPDEKKEGHCPPEAEQRERARMVAVARARAELVAKRKETVMRTVKVLNGRPQEFVRLESSGDVHHTRTCYRDADDAVVALVFGVVK